MSLFTVGFFVSHPCVDGGRFQVHAFIRKLVLQCGTFTKQRTCRAPQRTCCHFVSCPLVLFVTTTSVLTSVTLSSLEMRWNPSSFFDSSKQTCKRVLVLHSNLFVDQRPKNHKPHHTAVATASMSLLGNAAGTNLFVPLLTVANMFGLHKKCVQLAVVTAEWLAVCHKEITVHCAGQFHQNTTAPSSCSSPPLGQSCALCSVLCSTKCKTSTSNRICIFAAGDVVMVQHLDVSVCWIPDLHRPDKCRHNVHVA